jgi:hypothetical protein
VRTVIPRPSRLTPSRAAVIATVVTLPAVLALALVFARLDDSSGPVPSSIPQAGSAGACARLLQQLPVTLNGLAASPPGTAWPYTAAWGTPAVVLRCGVPRPAQLAPESTAQLIGSGGDLSVNWLPIAGRETTVWTTVDREVYIAVTVPVSYAMPPIAELSNVIETALPAVCTVSMVGGAAQPDQSVPCTRRP